MKIDRALKVPEKSGEFFCSHDLTDIPSILKFNQELIDSYSFKIAGSSYHQFRKKVETEILNLSKSRGTDPLSRPYIATGHQPGLCHPGIWIKNMLVDKIAVENQGTAFDIVIDSDCPAEIGCYLLTKNDKIKRKKEVLVKLDFDQPIECCSAPDNGRLKDFYQNIQADLQSFPGNPVIEYAEKFFKEGEKALSVSKNIAEFLVKTRKGYETDGDLHYCDIMLSHICKTDSFLLFTLHIAEDVKRFYESYNRQLEDYRSSHRLRYKANPFPDLKRNSDRFEVPFWYINDNKRHPVWVIHEDSYISFYGGESCLFRYKKGDFDDAVKIINEKQINLRPKAVLLTLFLRLFFADMFVHGISAAKYDEITDGIIENYFKVKPPSYIAASFTIFPDFSVNKVQKNDIEKLKTIIRNIKFKPEIFEDRVEGDEPKKKFKKLVEEKNKLLRQKPSKKERKEHYRQLKIVTEDLSTFLNNYYLETRDQVRILEENEQENRTVRFREFPYFFYDINRVKETIK